MLQAGREWKNTSERTARRVSQDISELPPSGRPSENRGDFRQNNNLWRAFWHSPAEPPPRPRDENYVFVTNCPRPEQTPPDPTVGQQVDCRGRAYQFSSRTFPRGTSFPNPLLIAASFDHLKFSYRTIPQRRIRTGGRLIAGAKMGQNFRHETGKPVASCSSRAKQRGDSLYENRSVVRWWLRSATALLAVSYGKYLQGMCLGLRLVLFNGNVWPSFAEWRKWTSFRKW